MNLPEKSDKQIIMNHIIRYFEQFRPGDKLRTDDVVKRVRTYHTRLTYPDTVLRYCRELRQLGKIHYTCINKHDRTIKIINSWMEHSL